MRRWTILVACVISASLPLRIWAQQAEYVQDSGPVASPTNGVRLERLLEQEEALGDPRLLPTEFEVAREQVRIAQSNLEHFMSGAKRSEPADILTMATSLAKRLEAWLKIADQLGRETRDLKPLRRLQAEIDVEIAVIGAARARQEYENTAKANPPRQRILVLQRQLDVAENLIRLSQRQVTLLDHVAGHAKAAELNVVLKQLRTQHKHLLGELDETLREGDRDAIVALVDDATQLIARNQTFVEGADQLLDDGAPREAIDLVKALLAISKKLLRSDLAESGDEGPNAELRTLMVRRLALLRDDNRQIRHMVMLHIPGVTWHDACSNSQLMLKAELDLCKTAAERIARYQSHVKTMRQTEKLMAEQCEAGVSGGASKHELRQVQISRLTAEIGLKQEILKATK